jgi:type II secretory pathway predicted ATPase ExeA
MYNDFFGFSEAPFNITPNPRFFYRTQSGDEVLQVVRYGIESRKGLLVVVGEPGSGKTLFLRCLIRDLPAHVKPIVMQSPEADLDEIIRLLFEKLELGDATHRAERLERLAAHLIEQRRAGKIVCLLIDEAQDLAANTLDDLRLLANLECDGDALLPIVLFGQPELNAKLDGPGCARMKQRVALTRNLYPLIRKEIAPYINTRLTAAGYRSKDLFDAEAIDSVAAHSGGIPRMVNAICDNALLRAYAIKDKAVSATIVDQVARELRIGTTRPGHPQSGAALQETAGRRNPPEASGVELGPGPEAVAAAKQEALRRDAVLSALSAAERAADEADAAGADFVFQLRRYLQRLVSERRLRWYTVAGALVLLLLALNVVNSSPVTGIYSAISRQTRAPEASRTAPAGPAPTERPANEPSAGNGRSVQEMLVQSQNEKPRFGQAARNGAGAENRPAPPAASPAQGPDPGTIKYTGEKRPAVTLEVVGRSKVRAEPSAGSEIIAELEPGNRVTLLAKSRDYYHVRSVDDRTIRGYVHREDAFFENSRSR